MDALFFSKEEADGSLRTACLWPAHFPYYLWTGTNPQGPTYQELWPVTWQLILLRKIQFHSVPEAPFPIFPEGLGIEWSEGFILKRQVSNANTGWPPGTAGLNLILATSIKSVIMISTTETKKLAQRDHMPSPKSQSISD